MKNKKDYKVGFGKPPKSTQFKPGKSGNPRGRPKKIKNTYEILKNELDQEVILKEGGKTIVLSKKQALLRHLVNKAVKGDTRAMFFVFGQILAVEASEEEKAAMRLIFSEEDSDLLDIYVERKIKERNNE